MSTREPVRCSGIIRGAGGEATCTVYAMKVSLPGTDQFEYVDWSVKNMSVNLPDGPYQVSAFGRVTAVAIRNGYFLNPHT